MGWAIDVEPGGLVRVDPGPEHPELRQALNDCASSLSPIGTAPSLSTYWIDRLLGGLVIHAGGESLLANGDEWSLVRRDDTVIVRWDYGTEGEQERESIPVGELLAGVRIYRDAVERAIEDAHQLDDRWWAQKVPFKTWFPPEKGMRAGCATGESG
jgi:hypothetical protein